MVKRLQYFHLSATWGLTLGSSEISLLSSQNDQWVAPQDSLFYLVSVLHSAVGVDRFKWQLPLGKEVRWKRGSWAQKKSFPSFFSERTSMNSWCRHVNSFPEPSKCIIFGALCDRLPSIQGSGPEKALIPTRWNQLDLPSLKPLPNVLKWKMQSRKGMKR